MVSQVEAHLPIREKSRIIYEPAPESKNHHETIPSQPSSFSMVRPLHLSWWQGNHRPFHNVDTVTCLAHRDERRTKQGKGTNGVMGAAAAQATIAAGRALGGARPGRAVVGGQGRALGGEG